MATCQSCGSEVNGLYCNECGERAPEEKAARKPKKEAPKAAAPAAGRTPGPLSPQRIWKTTATALLGLALFGGGMVTGFYMATPNNSASAYGDLAYMADEDLPPVAMAGKLVDLGVEYLNRNERSAAASHFRLAVAQYEKAIEEDPAALYPRAYLGLTYYYVGDSAKAIATLNEVLERDPNYLWAIFNLAWINQVGGKTGEAIRLYEHYLAVAPTEKQNIIKYAEQVELIDRQVEACKSALADLKGGGGQ